ncbi:MAG: pseudouridine synthase [Hydrogenophaga sp.]
MPRPPRNPLIPVRDGVSASCVALPHPPAGTRPWENVLDFLAQRLPKLDRDAWSRRLACGQVVDEAGRAVAPDTPYQGGTRLFYWRALDAEPVVPFEERVLFQDAQLVVADKPHFLPVTPGGRYVQQSLLVRLKRRLGLPELSPVHRIDRETAGLVVFSVRAQDRAAYQALFRERRVDKQYEAIAPAGDSGRFPLRRRSRIEEDPQAFFRMHEVPGEANSETAIDVIEHQGNWARYRLVPVTGKRHQLRVHLHGLGLPIAGDQFYPQVRRGPDAAEDFSDPLRLLAAGIAFTDPLTGQARAFTSGLSLDWPSPPHP